MQAVRPEDAEALPGLLQQILRDRDIDQRRMDIAVPEVGRQVRKAILRIDAGAVPVENPVHDERVTNVVNTGADLSLEWFDAGAPQDVDEQPRNALRGVYSNKGT